MNKASGYSLWLVPPRDDKTFEFLRGLIQELARKYETPTFDPHVTLLGGIEGEEQDIVEKTKSLASSLSPHPIWFDEVGTRRTFFQALFIEAAAVASRLVRPHLRAKEMFGTIQERYFPHLSLAYADLQPDQLFALMELLPLRKLQGLYFVPESIELWRTEGEVKDWCLVDVFPLRMI